MAIQAILARGKDVQVRKSVILKSEKKKSFISRVADEGHPTVLVRDVYLNTKSR